MNVLVNISHDLKGWAKGELDRVEKATLGALYDATYFLYKEGKAALRGGQLGLEDRKALTNLREARRKGAKIRGGAASKIPLRPLSGGVIYKVFKGERRSEVGFIGQERGGGRIAQWAEEFAARHEPGYTILYDDPLRRKLHGMGIHLKKTTVQAAVPRRGIMSGISGKYTDQALKKLEDGFDAKMRGERT